MDEGHDFETEWLRLIVGQASPSTESLLLLYDNAQNLTNRHLFKRKFSFKSVGVKAQGRTSILRLNYPNTKEILQFAYAFSRPIIASGGEELDEDDD